MNRHRLGRLGETIERLQKVLRNLKKPQRTNFEPHNASWNQCKNLKKKNPHGTSQNDHVNLTIPCITIMSFIATTGTNNCMISFEFITLYLCTRILQMSNSSYTIEITKIKRYCQMVKSLFEILRKSSNWKSRLEHVLQ